MADESYQYDVLVVGGGNAACCAAFAALEKTPRVGIIEKSTLRDRGGNSAMTGHIRFAFNGVEDLRPLVRNMSDDELRKLLDCGLPHRTAAEMWDELMRATNNQSDQEMLQVHVTESLKTVQWLASKGHDWVPATATNDNVLTMNGGGAGLQKRNFQFLETAGVEFHYETAAMELIQDSQGRVTGVRALTPNGYATFNAKAVVLACGGFEANPEMRARYLGPDWDTVHVRGVPFNTGDGLRMAMDIGAMPHGSWTTCHASPQDIDAAEIHRAVGARARATASTATCIRTASWSTPKASASSTKYRTPAAGPTPTWVAPYSPSPAALRSRSSTPNRAR